MLKNKARLLPALTLCLIFIALLPAMVLRDLNPVNELNYLAIAADALERGTFFAFYQDGAPYADKPPLYLWWCMLSYKLSGIAPGTLLLFSVLPFIALLWFCMRLNGDKEVSARVELCLGFCTVLFMTGLSLVARMDMLFALFIAISYGQIIVRVQAQLRDPQAQVTRFDWALPLTMFVALFVKGPYAIIFPLVALLLLLICYRQVRLYFKIFRPRFFLIILACVLLWGLLVYVDGGMAYLEELFVGQSAKRLSGSTGHPEPIYWYLTNIWYLAAPLALPALYLVVHDIRSGDLKRDAVGLASLCFFLAVFIVISLPSSKLEIYLLPGLPFLALYVWRSLVRLQGQAGWGLQLLLGLNFLPFALIFPALFFFTDRYPFLDHLLVYIAALLLSLGSVLALVLIYRHRLTRALAVGGAALLSFLFCLGLSLPALNPYLGIQQLAMAASADLEGAASAVVCTRGISKPENLVLYDKRFVIYKNPELFDSKCQQAALLVGRSALRSNPEWLPLLKARGAYYIGDNIYVPAPRRGTP